MAKRKGARAKGRKTAGTRAKTSRPRARARSAARRGAARKPAKKRAGATTRKATRKARKATARKATARKASVRKASVRKAPARKMTARKSMVARRTSEKKPAARQPARRKPPKNVSALKVPALNRARRIVQDDDLLPSPPSSLDLDRTASAARSGRRGLSEKFREHTETSPTLTGGDIDGDWESAYSVGDEAPGGDNPTPDQDIVDDIGKALGVQYEDNEELKGEKKISDRDKKRWELDPASAEDYDDR